MRKYLMFFVLVFAVCGYSQVQRISSVPFTTGNDTIANIDQQDTLQARIGYSGLGVGPWKTLTSSVNDTVYITVTDKSNEAVKIFRLSDETWWTWADYIEFRILSASDTITSTSSTRIGDARGAVTGFLLPDTTGTNTVYRLRVGGN